MFSWLETHVESLPNFLQKADFYTIPLTDKAGVKAPFANVTEARDAYEALLPYLRRKSVSLEEKDALAHCFALAMAKFLIEAGQVNWLLRKVQLDWKKVVYRPLLTTASGQYCDVIGIAQIHMLKYGQNAPFKMFYRSLTDLPPTTQATPEC